MLAKDKIIELAKRAGLLPCYEVYEEDLISFVGLIEKELLADTVTTQRTEPQISSEDGV